jgi:hypothetical protein
MANTTNFGWETPDDTDLVKDGAAAIRTLAGAIDTSLVDLKGGTTNQVLAKNSDTNMDFKWVADASGIPATIFDAKGDLIVASAADTAARLAVGGTDGHVLTVASGATNGIEWAAPAAGGMTLIATTTLSGATTTVTISANTYNYLVMVTEKINCSNDATPQIYANGTASITDYVRLNGYGTSGQDLLSTADTNLGLSWAGASDFESGNTDNAAVVTLYNINNTGHKPINVTSGFRDNSSLRKSSTNGGGQMKLAAVVTSITYTVTAGTFNGGTLYTYGVK